jgi:tryptophan synthase alpha subunit
MGNIKTKSNKKKILIYFIAAIGIAVIILITIIFATRKSALEKCADVGFIYIWGEQNKAYLNKSFKEKMSDSKNFKDFPYAKLFGICDQSQRQYPEKFKEKWGK